MRKLILLGLSMILLITFSFSQTSPTLTREYGGVKIENDDYMVDWDMEISGYSPHSGKFIMEGELISKQIDRDVDVCIVSPVQFNPGSKAVIEYDDYVSVKKNYYYYCGSGSYGWEDFDNKIVYCDSRYADNSSILQGNRDLINVSDEYYIDATVNDAVIYWNETVQESRHFSNDITGNLDVYNKNTIYGNYQYCGHKTYKADVSYNLKFEIDVDKEDLPVKYSVCFGDIASSTLHFCLDPEIVDSRTWTSTADFQNGTQFTGLETGNNEISLLDFVDIGGSLKRYYNFTDTCTDSTGEEDCTLVSAPPTISSTPDGADGAGYHTDGSADCIVTSLDDEKLLLRVQFTICSLVNQSANTGTLMGWGTSPMIADIRGDGTNLEYFIRNSGSQCKAPGGPTCPFDITTLSQDEAWHHFCWRLFTNDQITVSMDGEMISNQSSSISQGSFSNENENAIGCLPYGTRTGFHNAQYDEWAIYNVSKTNEEIRAIANGTGDNSYCNPFRNPNGCAGYVSHALFSDRQEWSPQAGNSFENISIVITLPANTAVSFRYNATNSSLDTSAWRTLAAGTNLVELNGTGEDDSIFYQFNLSTTSDGSNPLITSYTINEAAGAVNAVPNATLGSPTNDTIINQVSTIGLLNVSVKDGDAADDVNVTFYNSSDNTPFCRNSTTTPGVSGNNVYCGLTMGDDEELKWYVNTSNDGVNNTLTGVWNFTMNITGDSCDTCVWDATENCDVTSQLDCSTDKLVCTGAGQIVVTANVINCDGYLFKTQCKVRTEGGAKLCD